MSQPSRPRSRGPLQRRRREFRIEALARLEEKFLLAPVVVLTPPVATFTTLPVDPLAPNNNIGVVSIADAALGSAQATANPGQEPVTTVNQLTPASSFGGDIVRIEAGPGGDFGKGVYAISRGAGENTGAANRPGVIYRVDPATGKTSVFADLNTVVNQLSPGTTAANSVSQQSGLVNWYDLSFDPEGYFDGRPSLFVASVDRSNPAKNAIYRFAPDGSFMGAFVQFNSGQSGVAFNINPTSIVVPPPEDQTFLKGLISGSGSDSSGQPFSALFFNANAYAPGQNIASGANLPAGVTQTNLSLGPQVGLTASNPDYASRVYSVFTDFGTPASGGIPAAPGFSGVQGITQGELLISPPATTTTITNLTIDQTSAITTPFRRFEDVTFDQYGYFSQGLPLTTSTTNGATTFTLGTPQSAGNLFVADLATGLQVSVTPRAPLPTTPINVPVQGPGPISLTTDANGNVIPVTTNGNTTGGTNIGGRILRITPAGVVTVFAENFNTSGAQDSTSFINSSLSITFSADGTTLYASDDDGIWQFKTTASLAGSTSGSLVGLNDLRTLGVPYEGQDSAVAILDSGVDALSTPFRGRVAPGTNVVTGGFGNDDTSPAVTATGTTGTATNTTNTVISTGLDGHGTLVAGVVAQFVPQATLLPVNIFNPFQLTSGTSGTTGGGGAGNTGATLSFNSNASTTVSNIYNGIKYVADNPFVNDPIRPKKADRVIAATFGWGSQTTFDSEGVAYRQFPQIVIALKNQLRRYRQLGITPIGAAGQFGNPLADGNGTGTGGAGGGGGANGNRALGANNAQNGTVGDSNGMSLPAVLNEVVSATSVIPFPYVGQANSPPTDPTLGVTPRPGQPVLMTAGQTGTTGTTAGNSNTPIGLLLSGNTPPSIGTGTGNNTNSGGTFINGIPQGLYADRIIASSNRSVTTDYAAPGVDLPTFRRTFNLATTTTTTGTTTTNTVDPNNHLTFSEGGTSLSAGVVAGSFALVSSALNYWTVMNQTGTTVDAYLTQPVGQNVLNFGPHPFKDLKAYNSPDGINAILAWTSVYVNDPNDSLSQSQPPYQFGTGKFREFARIDVGNAVAAIEGEVALQYLLDHNIFPTIDSNKDNIVTSVELQNFVDNATAMGLPEAGAMARLLGGTSTTPAAPSTSVGELPDQAGTLQRRFNFFDYAADGQLNGSITIPEIKMLAHTLLPTPDSFVITDRQRASANGSLLDPNAARNFQGLQHLLPRYMFVPKGVLRKYRNISPDRFGVNRLVRNVDLPGNQYPVWTLFGNAGGQVVSTSTSTSGGTSTTTTPASSADTSSGTKGSSASAIVKTDDQATSTAARLANGETVATPADSASTTTTTSNSSTSTNTTKTTATNTNTTDSNAANDPGTKVAATGTNGTTSGQDQTAAIKKALNDLLS
jgi:hypothetical protein